MAAWLIETSQNGNENQQNAATITINLLHLICTFWMPFHYVCFEWIVDRGSRF